MGPEAPTRDDGFSSVFPSGSWGGINHHMFGLEFLGFSSIYIESWF